MPEPTPNPSQPIDPTPNKKQSIDVNQLKIQSLAIVRKVADRHGIIIGLVILGAVGYSVISVNQIISMPPDETYRNEKEAELVGASFDERVIEEVRSLQDSNNRQAPPLPGGRLNPFTLP